MIAALWLCLCFLGGCYIAFALAYVIRHADHEDRLRRLEWIEEQNAKNPALKWTAR